MSHREAEPDAASGRRADAVAASTEEPVLTGAGRPGAGGLQPANSVEEDLLAAAGTGSTDTFLSTLLLARVLLPACARLRARQPARRAGLRLARPSELDGETCVVVYTSPERLADHTEG